MLRAKRGYRERLRSQPFKAVIGCQGKAEALFSNLDTQDTSYHDGRGSGSATEKKVPGPGRLIPGVSRRLDLISLRTSLSVWT